MLMKMVVMPMPIPAIIPTAVDVWTKTSKSAVSLLELAVRISVRRTAVQIGHCFRSVVYFFHGEVGWQHYGLRQ
jgi:hypothetical protein